MTLGFCLFLAIFLLTVEAAAPGDRFIRAQIAFAHAHNDWRDAIKDLSPASPDYEQRVKQEWLKREVGQKFRKLERSLGTP